MYRMQRRRITRGSVLAFATCAVAAAAISCGSNQPSDDFAKQTWLKGRGEFLTVTQPGELVSFRKIYGVASESDGVKYYEYRYEATLRCRKDWSFGYGTTEPYVCKTGDLVIDRGEYAFRLTENGWESIQ